MGRWLPGGVAHDEPRLTKKQLGARVLLPRGEQSACVVKVQMREHDHIDVLMRETRSLEVLEQDMTGLQNPITIPELGTEKGPYARLEKQKPPARLLDQH